MNWDQFWLTDTQFSKIEPHLPTDTRGKARVDDRRVISGIIHVLKSGSAHRTLLRCVSARCLTHQSASSVDPFICRNQEQT